jgi:hypothetical protein
VLAERLTPSADVVSRLALEHEAAVEPRLDARVPHLMSGSDDKPCWTRLCHATEPTGVGLTEIICRYTNS